MLVLSRKEGEKVFIGDNLVVEVAEIRGDKVRIGFTAPREIPIEREEVRRRMHQTTNTIPAASLPPEYRVK